LSYELFRFNDKLFLFNYELLYLGLG